MFYATQIKQGTKCVFVQQKVFYVTQIKHETNLCLFNTNASHAIPFLDLWPKNLFFKAFWGSQDQSTHKLWK